MSRIRALVKSAKGPHIVWAAREMSIDDYIQQIGERFIGLWTVHVLIRRQRTRKWCVSYLNENGDHEETSLHITPHRALRECLNNLME